MFARLGTIGAVVAVSLLTVVPPGVAAADETAPTTVEQLFVQTAREGSLRPVKGEKDVFTLTLRGLAPKVTSFTDRPLRATSPLGVEEFLTNWDGGSFESDPPNAALVIDDAPESRDTFVFELTAPDYDAKRDVLRYTATLIEDEPNGRLTGFADQVDERPPTKFGRASLFIDTLPSTDMTVTFFAMPAGSLDGFRLNAFTSAFTTQPEPGTIIDTILESTGSVAFKLDASQQGAGSVIVGLHFCVAPGVTSLPMDFAGPANGTIIEFDLHGVAVQRFTASGTLQVPPAYQLEGCGQ